MTQLLQNAVYGTALILVVALLRRVLKDRLVPGARLALWAVCLLRLLTPAAPESVLSLWGLFRPRQAPAVSAPISTPAPVADAPQLYTPAQAGPSPTAPAIPWELVLLAVWLVVGAALAVRYALNWRRTRRAVGCAIPVDGRDPRYAPLPKCARLREGPMEGAPLTFGVMRPTVVLCPGLEGDALGCVLAHEGVHASRRDNLWHYTMATALIVHWWNPAVWLMARLLRRDIELSCDRAALKKLGADRRAEYANALVSMATQESGPAFCQTFGRKAAEERIRSVMKFKKTSVIGVVLSLALVLAVTVAFASAPKEPKEPDAPDTLVVDGVTLTGDAARYASLLHAGMTRDEVHQLLGEPSFSSPSLYSDTYELDLDSHERQLSIYYEMDGTIIQVKYFSDGTNPDVPGLDLTPFLTAGGEDQPNYVDPDSTIDPSLHDALEAAWYDQFQAAVKDALDKSKTVNDYDVRFPDDAIGGADSATGIYTAVPVPSAVPEPIVPPPVSTAPSISCGVEGCAETRYHAHNEGHTILLSDPCPVEGCTITGNHIHGDVCYSCNGAGHSGGRCDGSCYTYNTLSEYAPSSTSGHHAEGHHGNGHH